MPTEKKLQKRVRIKGPFLCSMADLMVLFGVSHETISSYTRNGMPRSVGGYDVKACLDWWLDNIYKAKTEENDDSINEHKRKYWKEKAVQIEFQNEVARGEFIKKLDVERGVASLIANLRASLLTWPSRVFPNETDTRARLKQEVNAFLQLLTENKLIIENSGDEKPRKATGKKGTIKKNGKQ
jgi:phage terminase Nu1 subunit (DNA packaging protein)